MQVDRDLLLNGMKVFVGADHRGFELKSKLLDWLKSNGYESEDCGAFEYNQTDDYPDFAKDVGEKVVDEEGSRGIVICGSGAGVDIVANKIRGIRCTLGFGQDQIKMAVEDDDLNVLALSATFLDERKAIELAQTFLEAKFDPTENHLRRIEKIRSLE